MNETIHMYIDHYNTFSVTLVRFTVCHTYSCIQRYAAIGKIRPVEKFRRIVMVQGQS
jgi:hypothetical protein